MLAQAFSAGSVVLYQFYSMEDVEDLELFLFFSDFIETFYSEDPEEFLCYSTADEALAAYEEAAKYLSEHRIPERLQIFSGLVELIFYYEFHSTITWYYKYDPKDVTEYRGYIDYLGEWLGLSDTVIFEIADEIFRKVQRSFTEDFFGKY